MIKVKQAECGHYVKADKPDNVIVNKPVRSFEVGYAVTHEQWENKDISVVFCDKCLRKITDEIRD